MSDSRDSSSINHQTKEDLEDTTITLNEFIDHENQMIQDAAEVLGASDDKICSYDQGYLKRQALFSCLTCIPESKEDPEKCAGICLACSYNCHDGHDLVELHTKRNFRCDCGNKKFNGIKCNLRSNKSDYNEMNKYNQNFGGLYCLCHRPHPDPENPTEDEMIQCIICEDWYHSEHLGAEVPNEPFAEMICESCVKKHEFLLYYTSSMKEETSNTEEKKCKKPQSKSDNVGPLFFPNISWRNELCTCNDCLDLYKSEDVLFLVNPEDPVSFYEQKGREKSKEEIETLNRNFINSLNRVQLLETIAGYNDLKKNLTSYLKKFAENNKVVREEDIREFFEGMEPRKKRRISE